MSSGTAHQPGNSGSFIQTATNLTPGTTYHFRAAAETSSGQVAYGQDMTFTTGGQPYYQNYYYPHYRGRRY